MDSSFSRMLTGLVFVVAGLLNFAAPGTYEKIMPPYLPLHRELVYLSGACEILGGLGLLAERTRRMSGIGLVLLLISVWPANVQMLLDARADDKPSWWVALLWARLAAAGRAHGVGLARFSSSLLTATSRRREIGSRIIRGRGKE